MRRLNIFFNWEKKESTYTKEKEQDTKAKLTTEKKTAYQFR